MNGWWAFLSFNGEILRHVVGSVDGNEPEKKER